MRYCHARQKWIMFFSQLGIYLFWIKGLMFCKHIPTHFYMFQNWGFSITHVLWTLIFFGHRSFHCTLAFKSLLVAYIITLLIMVIRRVTCLNIETSIFGETIIVTQIVIQMGRTFIYVSKNMKVWFKSNLKCIWLNKLENNSIRG